MDGHLGGGLHAGDLVLLGGPPGTGKTTVALQIARNAAANGSHALYVCFEHTRSSSRTGCWRWRSASAATRTRRRRTS